MFSNKLPFLKTKKTPRVAPEAIDEKLYGGSPDDYLEKQLCEELMDAAKAKDVRKFREALDAICMNMFETKDEDV